VIAGAIHDRYLSSRWKLFLDRGFFRQLVPWFSRQASWPVLVSGPLRQLSNLRQTFERLHRVHQGTWWESSPTSTGSRPSSTKRSTRWPDRVTFCVQNGYVRPRSFLGVGSSKIFRDASWGFLRPVFQVSHRYFRRHGMYDFPQYDWKTKMMVLCGTLITSIPGVRRRFFKSLKTQVCRCLQKEVEKADRPVTLSPPSAGMVGRAGLPEGGHGRD